MVAVTVQHNARFDMGIASREWATRPDDQRFLTLEDLRAYTEKRKRFSREKAWSAEDSDGAAMFKLAYGDDSVYVDGNGSGKLLFTHNSFGQVASRAGAPAAYLRTLPPMLAAANLTYGLAHAPGAKEKAKLYMAPLFDGDQIATDPADGRFLGNVLAVTGPQYGRIYDADVVAAAQRMNESAGGIWKVPAASYMTTDPRRATTLYASDRDVFIFLVDEGRVIEANGEAVNRCIIIANSEVGDRSLTVWTALYRFVCDNRTIWGASDATQIRVRHTSGAPERFIEEVRPAIESYATSSAKRIEATIKRATETPLRLKDGKVAATAEEQFAWFKEQGFGDLVAKTAVGLARQEEGDSGNVYQAVQGLTAYARGIPHTNARVTLEQQAGELLAKFAGE